MKFRTKAFFFCVLAVFLCQGTTQLTAAPLSEAEYKDYQKRFQSQDPGELYILVQEINQKLPEAPFITNGLRRFLTQENLFFHLLIAETLMKLKDPKGFEYLKGRIESKEGDSTDRLQAIHYLGNAQTPEGTEYLRSLLTAEDPLVKMAAMSGLLQSRVVLDLDFIETVYNGLRPQEKRELLKTLSPDVESYLSIYKKALEDPKAGVASTAYAALQKNKTEKVLGIIRESYPHIRDAWVRYDAELWLSEAGQKELTDLPAEYAAINQDARLQLISFVRAKSLEFTTAAASALSKFESVESDPYVLEAIKAPLEPPQSFPGYSGTEQGQTPAA